MKNKNILKVALVLLFSLTMIFVSSAYAPGDVDQNGMVSLGDVLEMMRNVGSANVTQYDLDGDGYVLLKDVLLLLDGVITPAKDAMTKLDVTTSTFGFTNGTWSFANGVAHGKNASVGDRYAMTDIYVEEGQAFTFEATIEFVSGTAPAAGIVFGVKKEKIIASGGAVQKNIVLQYAIAEQFGVELIVSTQVEEASKGAALFSAVAAGLLPDIETFSDYIVYK